jgi:hypothetical protein
MRNIVARVDRMFNTFDKSAIWQQTPELFKEELGQDPPLLRRAVRHTLFIHR